MPHLLFLVRLLALALLAMLPPGFHAAKAQTLTPIANAPGATEKPYGATVGWEVLSVQKKGRFAFCVAEKALEDGQTIRLGIAAGQWQLAVPYSAGAGDYEGNLEVDGDSRYAGGEADGDWTFVWLTLEDLDRVRNGNEAVVDIGRQSFDFQLKGTAAATTKIEECNSRQGKVKAAPVIRAAPKDPGINMESDAVRLGKSCPRLGSVVSPASSRPIKINFVNRITSGMAATIYWLDFRGVPVDYAILEAGTTTLETYVGHAWIVKDFNGDCYGGVMVARPGRNTFAVR